MSKQDKFTKAARGRDCQVRIPGVCNGNPETTVLAHYRMAGTNGMGIKPNSLQGAWACSDCHDCCDSRNSSIQGFTREQVRLMHAEGVFRTIDTLISEGVLKV